MKGRALAGAALLGILQSSPTEWLTARHGDHEGISKAESDRLVVQRTDAKNARDFATADALRATLTEAGIILEDSPEGTIWRRS